MHDVTPKVVAMAVSTVITMFSIFFQISCLFIVLNSLEFVFSVSPQRTRSSTEFFLCPPDGKFILRETLRYSVVN